MRGTESYEARRELMFGDDKIVLVGKATYGADALELEVDISGKISLPDDLCGHSVYLTRVGPAKGGGTRTVGEGSLFRHSGEELKVRIASKQTLKPDPLPHPIRFEPAVHLHLERVRPLSVVAGQRGPQPHHHDPARVEAVTLLDVAQAPDQQRGVDHEHQGQRDLEDHERIAKPRSGGAGRLSFVLHGREEIGPAGAQGKHQPEREDRRQGDRERDTQHRGIESEFEERGQAGVVELVEADDQPVAQHGHADPERCPEDGEEQALGEYDWTASLTWDPERPEAAAVTVRIVAASVATRHQRRDDDVRQNYFEVDSFPEITFASRTVSRAGENVFRVSGDLSIHGTSRPAVLEVEALGTLRTAREQRARFTATPTIRRQDYGITRNFLIEGAKIVGDEVVIRIDLEVVRPPG